MGRSSRGCPAPRAPRAPRLGVRRLTALGTAIALLGACVWAHPLEAAPRKKKKKPPPPTSAGEIDAPAAPPPPPSPAPPAAAPAPPPEPAPAHESASPPPADTAPDASHASSHARAYAPLGSKHTLVLDDLSGFRASASGGIGYAGPIGFSTQSYSVNVFGVSGALAGTNTIHATTIWFAPSADYFLFEKVSIGALIEIAWNSASYDATIYGTPTKSQSLPSTVNFTFIPRAGYMLALGEAGTRAPQWGLWPRLGMGLGVLQQNAVAQAGSVSVSASSNLTYLLDVDVGVLYRMDPGFYLRAGPELTWGPGAGLFDFSVAGGFGYMWSL